MAKLTEHEEQSRAAVRAHATEMIANAQRMGWPDVERHYKEVLAGLEGTAGEEEEKHAKRTGR